MSIFCRHRNRIVVARRGTNELRLGFTVSVMCSRCQKDLGGDWEGLPVLISYEEFLGTLLGAPVAFMKGRRTSEWNDYL